MNNPDIEIIAEVGSVHDGSFGNAQKLIEMAAQLGADIVKFQTHISAAETLANAPNPPYFTGETRYDYFNRTGFKPDQWKVLKAKADEAGIGFISSPFSHEAVDLLEEVGIEIYKIPSGEVSNIPLLEHIAQTGKQVYLSSGMSDWAELDAAVKALGTERLTIMQCSSEYPCRPENVGINVISEMAQRYGVRTGYSDHTTGFAAAILALAAGAKVIEKHITFSKKMYGSDAAHSMEPDDFALFCSMLKEAAQIQAHPVDKDAVSKYANMKGTFEKSIVTRKNVKKGEVISLDNIAFKKPGTGIPAARYKDILGQVFASDIAADSLLKETDIKANG